jgi:hypothetical protein
VLVPTGGGLVEQDAEQIGDTATVTVNGTMTLDDVDETIGALAGSGSVALGSGTLTLYGAQNGAFSGGVSGTGGLVKSGSGVRAPGHASP